MPSAACHFCSLPDDSIQVICDARCLLCSRCQIVPTIRKLLVDHTEFSPTLQNGSNTALSNFFTGSTILGSASLYVDNVSIPQSPLHGPTMTMHAVRGNCPLCESPMSASMLALIQTYWEAFKAQVDDEAGVSLTTLSH